MLPLYVCIIALILLYQGALRADFYLGRVRVSHLSDVDLVLPALLNILGDLKAVGNKSLNLNAFSC